MNYSGISYPVRPGRKGLFNIENDIKLIQGNIIQILATRKGERVMLPLFGSKILDFIHEPLDHITCSLLRFEVINAVSAWEPRIILDRDNTTITPYPEEFRVMAQLRYQIKLFHLQQSLILEINRREEVLPWLD
ncbi:MAG: GPW/gp25 family protein [Synergistaceae bacterium]|nr:GPW/gp25 family protein [Synergistaceae bacterium]